MSHDPSAVLSEPQSIVAGLAAATDAAACLALAATADAAGDVDLNRACLQRAVAFDRHCQAALLNLAALSLEEGDVASTFGLIEEAARVAPLPAEVEPLRAELVAASRDVPELDFYLRAIGRVGPEPAAEPLSIVIVTGDAGSGASTDAADAVADLAAGLRARGHQVRCVALEPNANGGAATRDGAARVRTAVTKMEAGLVLVADPALRDPAVLRPALERRVPVLHWMTEAAPAFALEEQPRDEHYWLAPASEWTGTALRNAGYETARMDTLTPGVPFARCFRLFLPDTQTLRIAFVGPLVRGSGADTLIAALAQLRAAGVRVTAELAGEAPDAAFRAELAARVQDAALADAVHFSPRLDRDGRAALLARTNTLVFGAERQGALARAQLEALAAGLAVVTSGTCGGREIIRDGVDGLLFRAGDAAALAAQLGQLAADEALLGRLQRQGQARAQTFSVDAGVRKVEELAAAMRAALRAGELCDVSPLV